MPETHNYMVNITKHRCVWCRAPVALISSDGFVGVIETDGEPGRANGSNGSVVPTVHVCAKILGAASVPPLLPGGPT